MKEYALEFVCAMGVGTVFVGLICLIIICSAIGAFCRIGTKKKVVAPVAPAAPAVIENKQEILAAVSAAIAEELGTDVSAIRITSFKKL